MKVRVVRGYSRCFFFFFLSGFTHCIITFGGTNENCQILFIMLLKNYSRRQLFRAENTKIACATYAALERISRRKHDKNVSQPAKTKLQKIPGAFFIHGKNFT